MSLISLLCAVAVTAPAPPLAAGAITLDDALAEAARSNPDLALSRNQVTLAGVDEYASWAGVLPRLDLAAAVGRDFYPNPVGSVGDNSASLTFQLPLFDGARSWNAIKRAKVVSTSANRSLDESRLTVSYEVTRRFYEVVRAREQLHVFLATVERSQEFAGRAEALFQAGRGSRLDVLGARGNLGTDRINVERAQARLDQTRADLAAILGRIATGDVDAIAPAGLDLPGADTQGEPAFEEALFVQAKRTRPLIAVQQEGVRASELDEKIASGAWWPVLAAQASYTRISSAILGSGALVADPTQGSYAGTVQLTLQWNLFAGRQTLAGEHRASASTDRARTQVLRAEVQVLQEIARARALVVALLRAETIATENLVFARQGVVVARERLQAGAANQLEVRDASLKLTQAELDMLNARIDEKVARADLSRAVGVAL
jgi:outer membrane protein TolC